MQLIFEDKQKRVIKSREEIKFSSSTSFHLLTVTARARSEKQISREATDDEDLIVKIDDKTFPSLGKTKRLINSPAAFSGGKLHNLSKTVYFLTFLKGKDRTVTLVADEPHNTATFEGLAVCTFSPNKTVLAKIEKQAEDGDRRPWITFVLDSLPLASITSTITYFRRKRDSDDVKVIIDGKIQRNVLRTIKHFLWRFAGSLLPKVFPVLTEAETFSPNLSKGLHYIEFYADRMPDHQFEPFSDPESEVFKRITDPPLDNLLEKKAWEESYRVAEQIISGKVPDPTNGANHFYATTIEKPYWAGESRFTLQVGIIRFYKL